MTTRRAVIGYRVVVTPNEKSLVHMEVEDYLLQQRLRCRQIVDSINRHVDGIDWAHIEPITADRDVCADCDGAPCNCTFP